MPTKKPLIGAAIVGQSGGPSSVINASAYGVIKTALEDENITKVYGAEHGIVGVLEDRLMIMDEEDPAELERLLYTPSSALGSCRYKIADPSDNDKDYKRILEIFEKYNVRYFFYIGGNDSMDTCAKISRYMSAASSACRRPSTTTSSARITARALPLPPSISRPLLWKLPVTAAFTTRA